MQTIEFLASVADVILTDYYESLSDYEIKVCESVAKSIGGTFTPNDLVVMSASMQRIIDGHGFVINFDSILK